MQYLMSLIVAKILHRLSLLPWLNMVVTRPVAKGVIRIPLTGGVGYTNFWISESWMEALLEKVYAPENGLFIDVGANLGQTLIKLRMVHPEAEYLGFEPNHVCVGYLHRLIEVNNLSKFTIIPAGLSDKSGIGVLQFYSEGNTDSSASMIEGFRPDQKVIKREFIPLITWDELQGKLPEKKVAVIKIDVEGAELEVLESLQPCIQMFRPTVLMEVLPAYSADNLLRITRQDRIMQLFQSSGYVVYRVLKDGEKLNGLSLIDNFGIHGDMNLCEYVAVHQENKDALQEMKG